MTQAEPVDKLAANGCPDAGHDGSRPAGDGVPGVGATSADDAGATPPLLTGGVRQHRTSFGALESRSVDFLTSTLSTVEALRIVTTLSTLDEPGYPKPGFAKTERRVVLGGKAWRRFEPRQSSNRWGMDYESWEWSGGPSSFAAMDLRGRDVKPTRIDFAYDFSVADTFTPDDFFDLVKAHAESQGIGNGISGQNGKNTRYIGSINSPRRIRIYRKDWQQPGFLELGFGPTLRIELVLKDEHAESVWPVWSDDMERGYAAAAAHIFAMTGVRVQAEVGEVPEVVMPEALDDAAGLFQFLEQYGPKVAAWFAAGIPVHELAEERLKVSSRDCKHRIEAMIAHVKNVGVNDVVGIVRQMIRHKGSKGCG